MSFDYLTEFADLPEAIMPKKLPTPKPLVSFIVINWKSEGVTAECVASLQGLKTSEAFEMIVFDNESTSSSLKELQKLPVTLLRSTKNLGFGGAINQAAKQATGAYIALINNDAVLDEAWLTKGLAAIHNTGNVALVGGAEFFWDGAKRQRKNLYSIPFVSSQSLLVQQSREQQPTGAVPYVTASNVLINKKAFDQVGGFDPSYFMYYEDMDLCAKLINAGYAVHYCNEMAIWHRINYSSNRNSGAKYFNIFKNRFTVIAKFFPDNAWKQRIIQNALKDLVTSSILALAGLFLGFIGVVERDKATIHYARIRAAAWALARLPRLTTTRAKHIRSFGDNDAFYALLRKADQR